MSIQSEIIRIEEAKADIRDAIQAKGVQVDSGDTIDTYPAYIDAIQVGPSDEDLIALLNGTITDAVIPNGVTTVGSSVFSRCASLTSVTVPDSVTTLDSEAFVFCTALPSITLPSGVTSVGTNAFYGCSSLIEITCYAETAPVLGNAVFTNVSSTGTLYVPEGSDYSAWLAQLPSGWSVNYMTKPKLKYRTSDNNPITIPTSGWDSNGVVEVLSNTYDSTLGCCVIKFSGNPTKVADTGLAQIYPLTSSTLTEVVEIPETVLTIGVGGIYNITYPSPTSVLTSVTLPSNLLRIEDSGFTGNGVLSSITLPSTLQYMGAQAFADCGLSSVTIPDSVSYIGDYAFIGCENLTAVTLPSGLTEIRVSTFKNCDLRSIVLPDTLTSIGNTAFQWNRHLTEITCNATTAPALGSNVFDNVASAGTLYVPSGSDYSAWIAALPSGWSIQTE